MSETVYYSVLNDSSARPCTAPRAPDRRSRRRSLKAPDRNGLCFYCECPVYPRGSDAALAHPDQVATNDHYTPFSISLGDHAVKIVTACSRCNGIKASTPPHIFSWFIRHTDARIGTTALRSKYRHFCYLLMAVGLKSAKDEARRAIAAPLPPRPVPPPRDQRGRFTIKDLRRGR